MVNLATYARSAGARLSERVTAAVWGQTRRCSACRAGCAPTSRRRSWFAPRPAALIGALVAGLHRLVDLVASAGLQHLGRPQPQHRHRHRHAARAVRAGRWAACCSGVGALVMRRFRATRDRRPDRGQRAAWRAHVAARFPAPDSHHGAVQWRRRVAWAWRPATASWAPASIPGSARYFRLRRADLRIFVTAGAGAAIAAAFNAPLAGAFYGYELILGSYTIRGAGAGAPPPSLAAALTQRALSHMKALFAVDRQSSRSSRRSICCSRCWACRGGLRGPGDAGGHLDRAGPAPPSRCRNWLRPAIGGVLLSAIALFAPAGAGQRPWRGAVSFRPCAGRCTALAILLAPS